MAGQLEAAGNVFAAGLGKFGQLKWVLIGIVILAVIIGVVYWITQARKKKTQWTHKFLVSRKLMDGTITPEVEHKARRFPLQQGVEVFELEKQLLGSFLIPQPGEYVAINTFRIILDENNRIWVHKGAKFNKETQSTEISAVHAGIDVEMHTMKERWQQAHKVNKKITTAELIKAGLKALMIVAVTIILIVAIGKWGDTQDARTEKATQEAQAMENLAEATRLMESTVNTQQLQLVPMLKALYGTDNIGGQIKDYCEEDGD